MHEKPIPDVGCITDDQLRQHMCEVLAHYKKELPEIKNVRIHYNEDNGHFIVGGNTLASGELVAGHGHTIKEAAQNLRNQLKPAQDVANELREQARELLDKAETLCPTPQ
jgi:hypothetical protein